MNKYKTAHIDTLLSVGLFLLIFPLLNVLGITEIDSDTFWSLAGLGLLIEGLIERKKENGKY